MGPTRAALWLWSSLTLSLLPLSPRALPSIPTTSMMSPPVFTRVAYRATIPENSVGKTYVTSGEKMGMHVREERIRYRITSGDTDKIFKAEEVLVGDFLFLLIRTRTGNSVVLNRERKDTFVLEVKAMGLDDRTINKTLVTVKVSDRNDLRPLFYQTSYQVQVPEDTTVHGSVVKIHAEDADLGRGGEVYYRFKEGRSSFAIHPLTGVVTLTRRLRHSENRVHELTVLAQDCGDSLHSNPPSVARLTLTVKPVNFHSPKITVKQFTEIYEYSDTNLYAVVTVVDKDDERNGQIDRLEIVDGDSNGHFRIKLVGNTNNTYEYNLLTYKILNRERYSKQYNLTLRATDKGRPSKFTLHSVVVNVEPVVEKYPIFEKEIYEIDIVESAPVNSPIIRLKISESHQYFFNEVHLEIVGGNEGGVFKINPQSGMLYTAEELDAEGKNIYILTVSALEQGKSGYSMQSSAKVKINVVDINDNDPIFEVTSMNVTVTENEPLGTSVAKVSAKDKDTGENGYISYSIANLNPIPFEIDHFTGVVKTIENLDYETMRRESLLYVRASDWGLPFRRETEIELRIRLRDTNDNKPQFERVNCSGSLSRYAPVGSEIMSLAAIDFDSGNIISYKITSKNTEGCFNLDLTSGILSVSCDLRYENFTERVINTTATDGVHFSDVNPIRIRLVNDLPRRSSYDSDNFVCNKTGVAKRLKEVLALGAKNNIGKSPDHRDISIMPKRYGENIHAPEILNLPATVQVNESVALGSKVMRIQANDRDLGYNGKLVFGVTSGDKDSLFRLDPETGVLKTIGHLDFEKETEYTLQITISDLGKPRKSSSSYLTILILDNNDNPPRFQQPMASLKINENTPNGTAIFKAIATDLDSTENARITYSLMTETEVFTVHPSSGVLYVRSPPDRELCDLYEIKIRASDGEKDSGLYSESVVLIEIDDVNDNPPKFLKDPLRVHVREDVPVGSDLAILESSDEDLGAKGEVVYSVVGNASFTVDALTGVLRLARGLDFEETPEHKVKISACDRGVPPLCASAVLEVIVVDVDENLHPPVFAEVALAAVVRENLPPGALVVSVLATDDDPPGEDSRVSYHIAGGSGVGYFSVDDDGVIRTTCSLDRESNRSFWLTLVARDHAQAPLTARLEVYVEVDNVNDNAPMALEAVHFAHLEENSPPGVEVVRLQAWDDDDSGEGGGFTFNIVGGNADGCFEIDRRTGILTTTRNKLDREHQPEHDLEITLTDSGVPALSSTARVVVTVDDVNDNAPQFQQSFYQLELPASTKHKQSIFQVLATDKDDGPNADIEYSLKTGRGKGRFTIHPERGVIYAHRPLVAGQEFELTVKASDHGSPNKTSTARLSIEIVAPARSAGAPVLSPGPHRVEVTEADPAGYLVAIIQANATGEDDTRLWFKITGGDPKGQFLMGVDPDGSVILASRLDCETQSEYNLTISVTNGLHAAVTQLHVTVLDSNEHRPLWDTSNYEVSVSAASPVGTTVARVSATDLDYHGQVVYELQDSRAPSSLQDFSLNHVTGEITLSRLLDRDQVPKHVLTVVAKDQGTPTKRNYKRVVLTVGDEDNHPPVWDRRVVQGSVSEDAEVGTEILQLMASDRDKGLNGEITYSILTGNLGGVFLLDSALGALSLALPLGESSLLAGEYSLTVRARDGGTPPLSATVKAHVVVTAGDRAPPRFLEHSSSVEVYENERAGALVAHLELRPSASAFFELSSGNEGNAFKINPATGTVTTLRPLDREDVDFYNLTVTARGSGASTSCRLLVHVLDRNDHPPSVAAASYRGLVAEDALPGTLVRSAGSAAPLVIYAVDADSHSNAMLTFTILEPKPASMFYVDGFTGTIRTKSTLDYEISRSVTMTVRTEDQATPPLTSDVIVDVTIRISDVNDCTPRFTRQDYNMSLLAPSYPDAALLTVEAKDEDSPDVTSLRYMILAGDPDGRYSVDAVSGQLSVKGLLPAGQPDAKLRVAVTDGRYSAHTRVNLHWISSAASPLVFQRSLYEGVVIENSTRPATVAVVGVVGNELGLHIRFRLANADPHFRVKVTSGALVTTGLPFDRELVDRYTLYVQAEYKDAEGVTCVTQTCVNVSVTDVNDNCPSFVATPYVTAVTAATPRHSPIIRVRAVDLDEGENGEVRYELTRGQGEVFRVDRKTGEITLKMAPQPSAEPHSLTITAYDGAPSPCSTEVVVSVLVLPDSAPLFDRQLYSVSVPESLAPHSLLPLRLSAQAPLGHPVIYEIEGDQDLFTIDVTAGALFTAGTLDFETLPKHLLRVLATDSLTGERSGADVRIGVTDVNDMPPKFNKDFYVVSVREDALVGDKIVDITAYDNDTGVGGQVWYSLWPPHSAVRVDQSTGSLHLQQPLDREKNSSLDLVLTASDSGLPRLSSSVAVRIHVSDVNDNWPQFERPTYASRLSDRAVRGQLVTRVTARDPDQGALVYSLVAGNEGTFTIHPDTGVVSVVSPVRLRVPRHELNISVSDGAHTATCRLTVETVLSDTHTPAFIPAQRESTVLEGQEPGAYVTTVEAVDPEGKVTYSIPSPLHRTMFNIDTVSGRITTARPLDREHTPLVELTVTAEDGAGRSDAVVVRVVVDDANDNPPLFDNHPAAYHACISPNLTAESVVLKVRATDADAGAFGQVEYSVYAGRHDRSRSSPARQLFGINSRTGALLLLHTAALYEGQHLQLFVRASDGGAPPLTSDAPVHIYVMRQGDTPPTFQRRDHHVLLPEDAPLGTVVSHLRLVSPMAVEYQLLGPSSSMFSVNGDGVVTLTASLDRERHPEHLIGVLARRPPLLGVTELRITVEDVNDSPPTFHGQVYEARVAEDAPEGTHLIRVTAEDPDSGASGEVRYSLESEFFGVDPHSGHVTLLRSLDRESIPRHNVTLFAADLGTPVLTASATLLVDVVDINDTPPTFANSSFNVAVLEDSTLGSTVCHLHPLDPDGPPLELFIVKGDPEGVFAVRSSGAVTIAAPLDRETVDSYQLVVAATDSKHVVSSTVHVMVLDVNDNRPVCVAPNRVVSLPEDVAVGSTVVTVAAKDLDQDPQLRFTLKGANAEHFHINSLTGELRTAAALDRETIPRYSLVAQVTDREPPSLGPDCTCHVTILLDDVNDNAPLFASVNVTVALPDGLPAGSIVTVMRATDVDEGASAALRYSLASPSEWFSVGAVSGLVTLLRSLDRAFTPRHTLVVVASDRGIPPLHTSASLHVLVVDVNDQQPEFGSRAYHAEVSESAKVGSEVTRVSTSSDEARDSVVYTIVAGNEMARFTVQPHTDRIVLAEPLDFENTRQYLLTVVATEEGEGGRVRPFAAHTTVNVTVTDANDNTPQFAQPSYTAEVSELAPMGHAVIQVTALDADSSANGRVTYSLVEWSHTFRLDPSTGVITLLAPLDRETTDSYVVRVGARDGGSPPLSSVAVIHVTVTDANDNPPLFTNPDLVAILQEDKPAGWAVCQLGVVDADLPPNAAPFIFEILYDDSGGLFRVDGKGVVQSLQRVGARTQRDTYTMQIRVYDSGSPPLHSDTWVTIKVVEESWHPPHALPLEVRLVVLEDRWPGGPLGRVTSSDLDPYDELTFQLRPASSLFTIDPTTGVLASAPLDAGRYLLNVTVSDGRMSTEAEAEVTVDPIWREDLRLAATAVRLIGISAEEFLQSERRNLIKALETVLQRNVSVTCMQMGAKYLELLLLIKGGVDPDALWEVLPSTGLRAAAPSCGCRHGARCRQRVDVDADSPPIRIETNTTIFIGPRFTATPYCACALGYTGDRCEMEVSASDCACSTTACLNPPCAVPSCAHNVSCAPHPPRPNITPGQPLSPEEMYLIVATACAIFLAVTGFVVYRKRQIILKPHPRRDQVKRPGAVDKLDITQVTSSCCEQDILAGIALNNLPRTCESPIALSRSRLDIIAEETTLSSPVPKLDDVESYGFPRSTTEPPLPDLQVHTGS